MFRYEIRKPEKVLHVVATDRSDAHRRHVCVGDIRFFGNVTVSKR